MSIDSIKQRMKNTLYSALIFVSLCLFGCVSLGSVIPVEKRMDLSETGKVENIFKLNDLTVQYSYTFRDGNMLLTCSAALRFKVETFDVRIVFLDAQGTVLQRKLVYSSRQGSIEKSLDVPPGTVSISFTYSSQPYRGHA